MREAESAVLAASLTGAITAHLDSLAASAYAAATISARRAHLRLFAEWCVARHVCQLPEVSPPLLEDYQEWLSRQRSRDGRTLSWSTHSNRLTGVRMFFGWATRTRRIPLNPAAELPRPRRPLRLPRAILTVSEVERVLDQAAVDRPTGLRDRAIMEVLYSTGIRRLELVGLDLTDFDAERRILFIREGKGRRDRVVPIGVRAISWVERYLTLARPLLAARRESGALFVTNRGARIWPMRLTDRLHRYIQSAAIGKPGSVHIFRHTMATLMHDRGADIRDLQEILGHAQLSTTEIYTRVSIERLKTVHARTHPAESTNGGEVTEPAIERRAR